MTRYRLIVACLICLYNLNHSLSAHAEIVPARMLIHEGQADGVHLQSGDWTIRDGAVQGRGERNDLLARWTVSGDEFRVRARLRILDQRASAASFFLGNNHFGFEGAKQTIYLNGPLFGGLQLLGTPQEFFKRGDWFDFEVVGRNGQISFLLNGTKVHSVKWAGERFDKLGFSPWRSTMQIRQLSLAGKSIAYAAPQPRGYTIPTLDLSDDRDRQVIVDREHGQYLGHPTTVLLEDGKTLLCVYPKGHGRGAIVYKRSQDAGRTWSPRLPTPDSWSTSKEVPTIHRVVDAKGKKRLIVWSGLYPARLSVSEDDGLTWSELKPAGDWGGIVVMGFVEALSTPGHYLAMFHDDGRFFTSPARVQRPVQFTLYKTRSIDGGINWSKPEIVQQDTAVHLCEPGCIRSPNGRQLAVLLRENSRRRNSYVIFSNDDGRQWTAPRELPAALTGDRHTGKRLPDGRLFISFRDTTHTSPTKGDWVAWVGTYDDIVHGREGQYRVRLMDNHVRGDCAYPAVEVLADGTIVTTTYGHWTAKAAPYIVSVRLKLNELDALAQPMK
ncbi:MAG: sialidase family protein [Planctomycetaceae bacterium]